MSSVNANIKHYYSAHLGPGTFLPTPIHLPFRLLRLFMVQASQASNASIVFFEKLSQHHDWAGQTGNGLISSKFSSTFLIVSSLPAQNSTFFFNPIPLGYNASCSPAFCNIFHWFFNLPSKPTKHPSSEEWGEILFLVDFVQVRSEAIFYQVKTELWDNTRHGGHLTVQILELADFILLCASD